MQTEFITSRGILIIEREVVYIKSLKPGLDQSLVGQVFLPAVLLCLIVLKMVYGDNPLDYITAGIFFILFFTHFTRLWDILFKRSFANRIPINRVQSFEIKHEDTGLETLLILQLKNGRYRIIPFRSRENQYQPLAEFLAGKILLAPGV